MNNLNGIIDEKMLILYIKRDKVYPSRNTKPSDEFFLGKDEKTWEREF